MAGLPPAPPYAYTGRTGLFVIIWISANHAFTFRAARPYAQNAAWLGLADQAGVSCRAGGPVWWLYVACHAPEDTPHYGTGGYSGHGCGPRSAARTAHAPYCHGVSATGGTSRAAGVAGLWPTQAIRAQSGGYGVSDLYVASLHIYPVKGLHGLSPPTAMASPWGLEGDRRWVVTDPDGKFLTQRTCRDMALVTPIPTAEGLTLTKARMRPCPVRFPDQDAALRMVTVWKDQVQARDAGDMAARWLEEALGRPCRLVWMHRPEFARIRQLRVEETPVSFADGYPLLLSNTASLDDLNTRLPEGQAVPMTRFRANIVLHGQQPWAEDGWRRLSIGGGVIVRVVAPCSRCVVTSIDQTTAQVPNPKEPLATLAGFRRTRGGVMFAQNAVVEKGGVLSVGDRVSVLEEGPSNLLDGQGLIA